MFLEADLNQNIMLQWLVDIISWSLPSGMLRPRNVALQMTIFMTDLTIRTAKYDFVKDIKLTLVIQYLPVVTT